MKAVLLGLSLVCSQAIAQSVISNPINAAPNNFNAANFVFLSETQGVQFAPPQAQPVCDVVRYDVKPLYVPPKEGRGPGWKGDVPQGNVTWSSSTPQSKYSFANTTTDSWQMHDIGKGDTMTQKIASSSSSSSSSSSASTSNWGGKTRSEATAESTVTVNGKTYRSYSHELKETPESTAQAQSYQQVIFCR